MISGSTTAETGGGSGEFGGGGGSEKGKGKVGGRAAKRKELDDAYEFVSSRPPVASTSTSLSGPYGASLSGRPDAAEETMEMVGQEKEKREDRVVLQFTFNDGELKSANGVGKVMNRRKYKYVLCPFLPTNPN